MDSAKMQENTFQPKLFIGIGDTGAFFTLRETYLHEWYDSAGRHVQVRSFHHFNLSQDSSEALAKANTYSEQMAIPLDASQATLEAEMRDIARSNAEQLAAREAAQKAQEAQWAEDRKERDEFKLAMVDAGFWPFLPRSVSIDSIMRNGLVRPANGLNRYPDGEWCNLEPIREKDVGLLTWFARKPDIESDLGKALQLWIKNNCADLLLPECVEGYIGEPGKRLQFTTTCIASFYFDGEFGRIFISELCDQETKRRLIVKSAAWNAKVGDTKKITGTIKAHAQYRGKDQTIIQRIKEVA